MTAEMVGKAMAPDGKWADIGGRLVDLHAAFGNMRELVNRVTYDEYSTKCAEGFTDENGVQKTNTVICGKCLTRKEVQVGSGSLELC